MRTEELDFYLPPELIAQTPVENRSSSRLLHYRRADRSIEHRTFSDLSSLLRLGDLLVFNDSKVIPARFELRKATGGRIEGFFLTEPAPGQWLVMLRDVGPAKKGTLLIFDADENLRATIRESRGEGEFLIDLSQPIPALDLLARVGRMPLPPYIKRQKWHDDRDDLDRQRYQTIYAAARGAIAAPTAGLHFTPELLSRLDEAGIERAMVTLHVGAGTFKPVTAQTLEEHQMHSEWYSINVAAAESLNRAKRENRRIVAVGTTSARVLESHPGDHPFEARAAETSIFIYPPYQWKHISGLVTNFHLPRSTLIALVAAMTGLDQQRRIYAEAVAQRYRFFSYGDATFIE
jgi:S-adenosylmethionine:tRNA ribosyltransferase-isomerase